MPFLHYPLELVAPSFGSSLTDLIIELDYLRRKQLRGSTHPEVFFQLKEIFHLLESIGSARIEGNNTTIAEYIETKIVSNEEVTESIREIQNIETAMDFIEENIDKHRIDAAFIRELHTMVVADLSPPPHGEGDRTPGTYRKHNVAIHKSDHTPSEWLQVESYMNELVDFINRPASPKYDLLKMAIAHHRFVWIHPFGNGNGRTVRLLTYAMLLDAGFAVNVGRIINPTAIFCSNRADYYTYLAQADLGTPDGILAWAEYVLQGLKNEIEKIDNLLDYDFLAAHILLPALTHSLEREYITETEAKILRRAVQKQVIQAADIQDFFVGKAASEISRHIKRLITKKMLMPVQENARKYVLRFDNNYLLRGVITMLGEKGFLPL